MFTKIYAYKKTQTNHIRLHLFKLQLKTFIYSYGSNFK